MSLLTVIKDTCKLLSLQRPSVVVASNDLTVLQLFACAVEEAEELAATYNWQALTSEHTFVTVAAAEQTDTPIPDDFGRFIRDSFYDRTTRRPVIGPVTPAQWQLLQANPQAGRIVLGFRQRDNTFLLTPTPPAGETIAFEYISTNLCVTADGLTPKPIWTLDTDETYLDEKTIVRGVRWRWRKSKGFPWQADHAVYEEYKARVQSRDGGNQVLSMVSKSDGDYIGCPTVPETGFGS